MIFGKEDLGLSLSLSFPEEDKNGNNSSSDPLQLNLASVSSSHSSYQQLFHQKSSFPQSLLLPSSSSDRRRIEGSRLKTSTLLKGIDVNRLPAAETEVEEEEEEEEAAAGAAAGVSSPNSTLSTISGKRSEPEEGNYEIDRDEQDTERACCSRGMMSDEEDGDGSRKKLRLSKDQSAVLEESFKEHTTLNPKLKLALSKSLGLRPRQVEVWFQNRRARTKLKQTEVDCEYLKRCFENLSEENRRLQKEVQELRALKLSPQFYMQMKPPTTLTMCPSCQRLTAPAPPSSSSMLTPPPPPPVIMAARPLSMLMPAPAHPPAIAFNPWGLGALHSRS